MFCVHNFEIALAKLSPPGMVTSSPTAKPETDITIAGSKA
jgi:hypothetical protein